MQNEHNKKQLFLDSYLSKACNKSETCKSVGIGRTTFYTWYNTDSVFKEAIDELEVSLVDLAETQLLKNIRAGKETSLIFFLTNRAPERWKHKSVQEQQVKMEFESVFGSSNFDKKFAEHFESIARHFGVPLKG